MFWSKIPFSDVDELDKRAVRIIVPVHGLIDLCVLFDSLIKVLLGFVFIHTDIVRAVKFHLSYRVIDDFRVVALAFDEEEFNKDAKGAKADVRLDKKAFYHIKPCQFSAIIIYNSYFQSEFGPTPTTSNNCDQSLASL